MASPRHSPTFRRRSPTPRPWRGAAGAGCRTGRGAVVLHRRRPAAAQGRSRRRTPAGTGKSTHARSPALHPTDLRATGMGVAGAMARVGSLLAASGHRPDLRLLLRARHRPVRGAAACSAGGDLDRYRDQRRAARADGRWRDPQSPYQKTFLARVPSDSPVPRNLGPELRWQGVVELQLCGSLGRGDAAWESDVDLFMTSFSLPLIPAL